MKSRPICALVLALAATLTGCSGSDEDAPSAQIVVGLYPFEYAAQRVAGDRMSVHNLAVAGAEPHDLELSAREMQRIGEAKLVVQLPGFQPAVDEALRDSEVPAVNAAEVGQSDLTYTPEAGSEDTGQQSDPHFWLDPIRFAALGDGIAAKLAEIDPDGAETYHANAATLRTDLESLNADYQNGLANCRSRTLVTSHFAFGYLADKYDLEQVGMRGLRPDTEPSPDDLKQVSEFVRTNGVTTIYAEAAASGDITRTVADDTGTQVAVLDPLETRPASDDEAAPDYLATMRTNLATLRSGQGCS